MASHMGVGASTHNDRRHQRNKNAHDSSQCRKNQIDISLDHSGSNDSYQLRILGSFCSIGGTFIMLLASFGKDARGVLCPLCMGGAILILGLAMYFGGRYLKKKEESKCPKTN